MFRVMNVIMAGLFALAVVLQYNDPDPARWMAIYGAAMAVSIVAAVRGRVPPAASILVVAVAIVWAASWSRDGRSFNSYLHMFDAWEMKNEQVEETRETSGLLIVVAWMTVLSVQAVMPRRPGKSRAGAFDLPRPR